MAAANAWADPTGSDVMRTSGSNISGFKAVEIIPTKNADKDSPRAREKIREFAVERILVGKTSLDHTPKTPCIPKLKVKTRHPMTINGVINGKITKLKVKKIVEPTSPIIEHAMNAFRRPM